MHLPSQESLYQAWMLENHPYTHVILSRAESGREGEGKSLLIIDKNYQPMAQVDPLYKRGEYTTAVSEALAQFPSPASLEFASTHLDAVQAIGIEFSQHYHMTYLRDRNDRDDNLLGRRIEPHEYTQDPSSPAFEDFMYDITNYRKGDAGKRQRELHQLFREGGIDVKELTEPESETIRVYTF